MPTNKQLRRKRSKKTNRTLNMSLKKTGGAKPNLIILIGAGQNWKYNQFRPEKQPSHSVIHVVDPLVLNYPNYVSCLACDEDMTEWPQSRRDEHVKRCEKTITTDLKELDRRNQFYKMGFNDYIPSLYDIIEQFNTITVITYTEMVKMNDVMPFLPSEQGLFIYDGHGAGGMSTGLLEQINITFKPLIDRINTQREYIDEQMRMIEGREKIELEAEHARDNGIQAIVGFLQTAVDIYNYIIEQIVDILDKSEKNPLLITKPLLKKAFIKIFGEDLLFAKQGYSGYPNESAEKLINGKCFNFINKLKPLNNFKSKKDTSLEWKIMNVEMFLRSVDF